MCRNAPHGSNHTPVCACCTRRPCECRVTAKQGRCTLSGLHPAHLALLVCERAVHVMLLQDDNSVVTLHPKTMEVLELFRGDTVLLKVCSPTVGSGSAAMQWAAVHVMLCMLRGPMLSASPWTTGYCPAGQEAQGHGVHRAGRRHGGGGQDPHEQGGCCLMLHYLDACCMGQCGPPELFAWCRCSMVRPRSRTRLQHASCRSLNMAMAPSPFAPGGAQEPAGAAG